MDSQNGKYPCILSTSNWLYEYEKEEWQLQAKDNEKEAMAAIDAAIESCRKLTSYSDMLDRLDEIQNQLYLQYPPRASQPETWRPQKAAHWASKWMKILAETHYADLSNHWRVVASNRHSLVVGFTKTKKAYLLDIILLTTDANKIILNLQES